MHDLSISDIPATHCLAVYQKVWGDLDGDDETTSRGSSIIRHMRDLASAPSKDAAYEVIRGWSLSGEMSRKDKAATTRARRLLLSLPSRGRPTSGALPWTPEGASRNAPGSAPPARS